MFDLNLTESNLKLCIINKNKYVNNVKQSM